MHKSSISEPQIRAFGRSAILVEWEQKIHENILFEVLEFKERLKLFNNESILYINHTYNSILITYSYTIENINDKILALKQLIFTQNVSKPLEFSTWEIPVCYDEQFAIDLKEISKVKGILKNQIIDTHSSTLYQVYFIGFLPGFLYLGGLPNEIHFDRKPTPRVRVEKGSVAIGGNQTGIYPSESPGGWNIIGNCPVDLFDVNKPIPCFAKAGDKLRFRPISLEEYHLIKTDVIAGVFDINSLKIND